MFPLPTPLPMPGPPGPTPIPYPTTAQLPRDKSVEADRFDFVTETAEDGETFEAGYTMFLSNGKPVRDAAGHEHLTDHNWMLEIEGAPSDPETSGDAFLWG